MTTDPTTDLMTFLTSGKTLPAVGAALVLIVGILRKVVLGKVPWFQTQLGGYLLGWGAATVLYVATSLEQGVDITLGLFGAAAAAGLTASGVLDHFRDIAAVVKPAGASAAVKDFGKGGAGILLGVMFGSLLLTMPACKTTLGQELVTDGSGAIICAKAEAQAVKNNISVLDAAGDVAKAVVTIGIAFATGGMAAGEAAIIAEVEPLIAKYGEPVIACAFGKAGIQLPGTGSGASTAFLVDVPANVTKHYNWRIVK